MSRVVQERRLSRRTLFRGRVVTLHVDRVRLSDGTEAVREVAAHRPAVAVVPVLADGRVVLIRQYRYAVGRELLEVPAGIMEAGETPRRAAARELAEETGFRARTWNPLGVIWSSPGFTDERIHLLHASDLRAGSPRLDADERVRIAVLSWQQIDRAAARGNLADAKTRLALTLARSRGGAGKTRL